MVMDGSENRAKRRVLIVEDDASNRRALERALRSVGFDVDLAACVQEGLAKMAAQVVALVDLGLPDGLGTTLLEEMRARGFRMPVAIISGNPDALSIISVANARPDVFFEKPVNLEQLLAWIEWRTSS